jgi:hypothetical protein
MKGGGDFIQQLGSNKPPKDLSVVPSADKSQVLDTGPFEKYISAVYKTAVLIEEQNNIRAVFEDQVHVTILPRPLSAEDRVHLGFSRDDAPVSFNDPLEGLDLPVELLGLFAQDGEFCVTILSCIRHTYLLPSNL